MNNLRLVIGPAPSELSEEELLHKVTERQYLVAAQLQAFRERMSSQVVRAAPKPRAGAVKKRVELGKVEDFIEELNKLGMTMEEFKVYLRNKGVNG